MAKLVWGEISERNYEAGVDRGVLYVAGSDGVAWNGLVSVDESPTDTEIRSYFLDGVMYAQVPTYEDFQATIGAINKPEEFGQCDGVSTGLNGLKIPHQRRKSFGLSYRTMIGNDVDGLEHGYCIHLVYNAMALPTQRNFRTVTQDVTPVAYSWQITALPPSLSGYRNTPHLIVDSRFTPSELLSALEFVLYGSDDAAARLPLPSEIFGDLGFGIQVTDNGDGTFTVTGPDDLVEMTDSTTFEITSPSAVFLNSDTYTITTI